MVIICDRFVDSTIAYQVYGKKINFNFVNNIHKSILNGLKPDLTFILKVSSKSSKKRLIKRNQDSIEEVEKRFKAFDNDVKKWKDYDYILFNENLVNCYKQIEEIIKLHKKISIESSQII